MSNRKHGESACGDALTCEYYIWEAMRRRCTSRSSRGYRWYGARGIKVCKRWNDYENFLADMGRRPSKEYTIERINNNGPYSPSNCRWATRKEQNRNRRSNHFVSVNGETLTCTEWSLRLGGHASIVGKRLALGWPASKAVTTPIDTRYSKKRYGL